MEYTLVVKSSGDSVARAAVSAHLDHLPSARILSHYSNQHLEQIYAVATATDATSVLNDWYGEDIGKPAPYADGSLLWWCENHDEFLAACQSGMAADNERAESEWYPAAT